LLLDVNIPTSDGANQCVEKHCEGDNAGMSEGNSVSRWRAGNPWEQEKQRKIDLKLREEHARREAAKMAVITDLSERVGPIVDDARGRGFVFFSCELYFGARSIPIRLRFGDGKGAYYERLLAIWRLAGQYGLRPTLEERWDINTAIDDYVRSLEGIRMLDQGMVRRRVRTNIGCL
jgi:hypothetical protein